MQENNMHKYYYEPPVLCQGRRALIVANHHRPTLAPRYMSSEIVHQSDLLSITSSKGQLFVDSYSNY